MSIKTWREEFFNVDPVVAAHKSENAAIEHSLLKWSGFLKKNLKKHKVTVEKCRSIIEDICDSCALCVRFECQLHCGDCPLFKTGICEITDGASFFEPRHMIAALKSIRKKS